jgi:hypothetical protein
LKFQQTRLLRILRGTTLQMQLSSKPQLNWDQLIFWEPVVLLQQIMDSEVESLDLILPEQPVTWSQSIVSSLDVSTTSWWISTWSEEIQGHVTPPNMKIPGWMLHCPQCNAWHTTVLPRS